MRTYIHENRTPNGNPLKLECRIGTNDQEVAHSVSKLDEYGLRGLELSGWAIDVGAYIGAVAIPLALDHPDLRVVAIEPVPENVALLHRNIELNNVGARVHVCPLAAAAPGYELVSMRYGGEGMHRYVGNVGEEEAPDAQDVFDAPPVTLGQIKNVYCADEFALMKIDCEGCEWYFLNSPEIGSVNMIVGELHSRGFDELKDLLGETHGVGMTRSLYNFVAYRW